MKTKKDIIDNLLKANGLTYLVLNRLPTPNEFYENLKKDYSDINLEDIILRLIVGIDVIENHLKKSDYFKPIDKVKTNGVNFIGLYGDIEIYYTLASDKTIASNEIIQIIKNKKETYADLSPVFGTYIESITEPLPYPNFEVNK